MNTRFSMLPSVLLLMPVLAEAHTLGAVGGSLAEGLAHPFMGLDHLLAMMAIGLWAGQSGGRAIWLVPGTFLATLCLAGMVGMAGFAVPYLEPAIAVSVIILGLFVLFSVRLSALFGLCLVGLFAAFHGYAHGLELPETASGAALCGRISDRQRIAPWFGPGVGGHLPQHPGNGAIRRFAGSDQRSPHPVADLSFEHRLARSNPCVWRYPCKLPRSTGCRPAVPPGALNATSACSSCRTTHPGPGDFVLIHVGYAIQKLTEEEAMSAWELFDQMLDEGIVSA